VRTDFSDGAGRRRIAEDLDTSFMVVAGAGTGKTTALVSRIVALVRTGSVSLREIAAITFTEAAAAEPGHRERGRGRRPPPGGRP
jgi:ATP-dependent helicase/nuclease subunit A